MKKKILIVLSIPLVIIGTILLINVIINTREFLSLRAYHNNILALNNKIKEIEQEHDEKFNQINNAKETYNNKNNELKSLNQKNNDLNNRLKSLDNEISNTNKNITSINQKINALKK